MNDLWDAGESSVSEVAGRFAERGEPLAYTTVLTTMTRLAERGLLTRRPWGRIHRYEAAVSREQLPLALSRQAIDRLLALHGDTAISAFASRLREGDGTELARLRDLLAEIDE